MTRQISIPCSACGRKFGGQQTLDRHQHIAGDRYECYPNDDLRRRGFYRDGWMVWHRGANPDQTSLLGLSEPVRSTLHDSAEAELGRIGVVTTLANPDRDTVGAAHRNAGDTERASAAAILPRSGTWRRRVLDAIASSAGLTDWEIHNRVGGLLYTVAPRRNELLRDGWICDSGERRRTNSRNKAIVWVLSDRGRLEWKPGT